MKKYDIILFTMNYILPEDHGMLLTEAALNPKANHEAIIQIMFESSST